MCIFFLLGHISALYGVYLLSVANSAVMTIDVFIQQQVLSMLGVAIGNHRLWSHKSFKAILPVRIVLMLASCMCNEGSIYWWTRNHVMHHKYSDTDADPHNSSRGLLFSHMTWLFYEKHPKLMEKSKEVDFSHLLSDPVVRFQYAIDPYFRHFMCFGAPTIYGYYVYNDWVIGLFVFGFLRWIMTLHLTWTVNSLAHYTGSRKYNKDIKPTDNWWLSVLTIGEGWHNYHHTYPYDYTSAEKHALIQYNPSAMLIDTLALSGMVYDRK
jgi:stearoyl-CoA desaturase (delta-9 desaturase)